MAAKGLCNKIEVENRCVHAAFLTNLDEWLHAFTVPVKQRLFEEGRHSTYSKCFSYYLYLLNFLIIITKKIHTMHIKKNI